MINKLKYANRVIRNEFGKLRHLREATGVKFGEYVELFVNKDKSKATLFGKSIKVTDSFWHLHSLNELFIDSQYEFHVDKKSPFIIDCGANVGLSTLFFKRLFPSARIMAYEPDPSIFEMLEYNLLQFGISDVQCHNQAIWTENTTLTFNATGALGGHLKSEGIEDKNENHFRVNAVRLKDILQNEIVDLLKIDIEGAEIDVIKDCEFSLANVKNIFIEYHRQNGKSNRISDFINILENSGFTIYIKEAWNNLPQPFMHNKFNPHYDLQLNIFGYRK